MSEDTLDNAIAARDEFLKNHPHLQQYQDDLDELLDKVPEGNRIEVITMLMHESMSNLYESLRNLSKLLPK